MSKQKIMQGNFVDKEGNVLGRHEGIIKYTIGQRKGLGIALGWPAYVVDIDPITNSVVLGTNEDVFKKGLTAKDVNIIPFDRIVDGMKVEAKVRYNARPKPATVYNMDSGRIKVVFDEKERAITPGQSVVMYQGDIVVGGGIIESSVE